MRPTLSDLVEAGLVDERRQFLALLKLVFHHDWSLVARTASTAGSMRRLLEDGLWDSPGAVRWNRFPPHASLEGWDGAGAAVQKELQLAEEAGSRLVTVFDEQFPLNLRRATRAFPFVSYDGTLDAERDARSVYVASCRQAPTAENLRRARIIGRGLARREVTVVGDVLSEIDRTVLQAALDVGGRAVAALLCSLGPNRYGYRSSTELCEAIIASGGAVMCASWPSDTPTQFTFRPSSGLKMSLASAAVVVERPPPYDARREARGAVEEKRPVFFVGPVANSEVFVDDDPWDPNELAPLCHVVYNAKQIARELRSFYDMTQTGPAKTTMTRWRIQRLRQHAAGVLTGVAPRTRCLQALSQIRSACTPPDWMREWLAEPHQRLTRPSPAAETPAEVLSLYETRRRRTADHKRHTLKWRGETVELVTRIRGVGGGFPATGPVNNVGYWVLANKQPTQRTQPTSPTQPRRPRRSRTRRSRTRRSRPRRWLPHRRQPPPPPPAAAAGDPDRGAWLEMLLAPLNAGMIDIGQLGRLDRDLQAIAEADEACFAEVSRANNAAVAMACAHWNDPKGPQWLLWALSARLEDNLHPDRGRGRGPGALAMSYYYKLRRHGFGRDSTWTTQMPPEFWHRLANHPDPDLRRAVIASDPQALGRDLARLVDEPGLSAEIADMIASHPRTPPTAQLRLATHGGQWTVTDRLSQNRHTSRRLLAQLARSPEWMLRNTAAGHRRAPRRLLRRLAKDCKQVRQSVARNPRTPKRTLRALAADPEPHVRIAAADNKAIPTDTLATLREDRHDLVREHAANNPKAN